MRWTVFLLLAASALAVKPDFERRINALLDENRAARGKPILEDWRNRGGENDPQYWIAVANVWRALARSETVHTDNLRPGRYQIGKVSGDSIELRDHRKAVGAMRFDVSWDQPKLALAYAALDEADRRFPRRLDIAVGRAYLHREAGDLPGELASLRGFVTQARTVKPDLLYGDRPLNEPAEDFCLHMLLQYAREHFGNDGVEAGRGVADLMVELFPERPHGYNLVANYYALSHDDQKVKSWLEKAMARAPEDSLVLVNLAECEARLGHRGQSQALFQRVVKLNNDPKMVKVAKSALEGK